MHPNNVEKCGHICNVSYAVSKDKRGHHIGEFLVKHCLETAKEKENIEFNAVVATNYSVLAIYKKFGFVQLGTIPQGFLAKMVTICTLFPTIKIWLISSFVLIDFDTTMSRY